MRDLIFGLARPMLRLLGRDERGGVGVLVAVLVGGGVLLGMGALVVDAGQLYQNRAELQNGADSGALAIAASCAKGTCDPSLAPKYANGNASALTGGMANVDLVCGSEVVGGSSVAVGTDCPTSTGATGSITDCPKLPSAGADYVDVHTSTDTPTGTLLPPVFAQALLGGSYRGATVRACARAEWGNAMSSQSLALTVSLCAWESLVNDTDADGDFGTDDDSDDTAYGTLIPLWIKGKAKACAPGPDSSGQNLPGGFGWLTPDCSSTGSTTCSNPCTATIDVNTSTTPPTGTTYTDPGANVTNDCKTALQSDLGTTVYIPVFDAYTGTGSSGTYHIIGLAAFFITGYANMTGIPDAGIPQPTVPPTDPTGYNLCVSSPDPSVNNQECIEGYFTQGLTNLPGPPQPPGPSFGVTNVWLAG